MGGQGIQTTPHLNIGFLSNTGLDPLKISKLPSQHSMLDHHRHASETPFKLCFTGGPKMVRFKWYLDHLFFPHQLKNNKLSELDPVAKLSGSAHDCAPQIHTMCTDAAC